MRPNFRSLPVIALFAAASFAQAVPQFSQYRAALEKPRIKAIDYRKNPDSRTFRTRLNAALKGGVNFAGRYILTGWGCGTGCTNALVIDTRTGKIYYPDELFNVDATYGDSYSDEQLEFRKNSRLLIIHGRPGGKDESAVAPSGDHYYEWRNNRFRLIKSIPNE